MTARPTFDAVYSVSDLHIGPDDGTSYSQSQWQALGALIGKLAERPGESALLALNGDIFDFLRFDGAEVVTWSAGAKIEALAEGVARPIFDGLRHFASQAGRTIYVVAGNHDIELALPDVQSAFRRLVGVKYDIHFTDGMQGTEVSVGSRTVVITHGNAVDPWNTVDFDSLARLARGEFVKTRANPGTALVLEFLKPHLPQYPFLEFLKPEGFILARLLWTLLPAHEFRRDATTLLKLYGRSLGSPTGMLGGGVDVGPAPSGEELLAAIAELPHLSLGDAGFYRVASQAVAEKRDPLDYLETDGSLSVFGALTTTSLRKTLLEWLETDQTFDIGYRDQTASALMTRHPYADIILAGHTHLERLISAGFGPKRDGVYVNSGTWMRLIQLDRTRHLGSDAAWEETRPKLTASSLADLDQSGLVRWPRPFVAIERQGGDVVVTLDHDVEPGGTRARHEERIGT